MSENQAYDKALVFAKGVLVLYKKLIQNQEYILSKQLLRSGTSIGANISEAISAHSKKEFHCKINIALKEARESKYWLSLLATSPILGVNYDNYLDDVETIIRILAKTAKTTQQNLKIESS